jgi:Na+/H+-translocating membrane pyrophosphatase
VAILDLSWRYFGCIVIGLAAGMVIGVTSEFFTSYTYKPTLSIAHAARIGPANVIIQGLSVGMFSCVIPALVVASVAISTYNLAQGTFGISLASVGLLSTLAITLATDAYGPVADNAGGIAEMAHMPAHTRNNTDVLDALGNTTAAIGKVRFLHTCVLTSRDCFASWESRGCGPSLKPFVFACISFLVSRVSLSVPPC